MRADVTARVAAAGGDPATIQIVEVDEVFLSYLPGRAAQLRVRAVGDLADPRGETKRPKLAQHAH